jgi:hypothetical protein
MQTSAAPSTIVNKIATTDNTSFPSPWLVLFTAAGTQLGHHQIRRSLNTYVHSNQSLVPLLSQITPVHDLPSCFFKDPLRIYAYPTGYLTKTRHAFLISSICAISPPTQFSLISSPGYRYRRWRSSLRILLHCAVTSSQAQISTAPSLSRTPSRLCSSLNLTDQVPHPHQIKGKYIAMLILIFTFLNNNKQEDEIFWTEW